MAKGCHGMPWDDLGDAAVAPASAQGWGPLCPHTEPEESLQPSPLSTPWARSPVRRGNRGAFLKHIVIGCDRNTGWQEFMHSVLSTPSSTAAPMDTRYTHKNICICFTLRLFGHRDLHDLIHKLHLRHGRYHLLSG